MGDHHHSYHPAHLFTLRLWSEELDKGEAEWRMQLRSVETGQTHHFRDWPSLVGLLLTMLPRGEADYLANGESAKPKPE
jgi:hypothetical protein